MNLNHARLPIPPPGLMAKRCRFLKLNLYGSDRPNATLTRQHRQPAGSKICIFEGLVQSVSTDAAKLKAAA